MEKVMARPVKNKHVNTYIPVDPPKKRVPKEVKKPQPKRLWDNYIEVASVRKSDNLKFVIAACTRDGFRCLNIREFYLRKRDNVWCPSRDGIVIPLKSPLNRQRKPDPSNPPTMITPLSEMLSAMVEAMNVASEMALVDPENARWLMPKENKEENKNDNS